MRELYNLDLDWVATHEERCAKLHAVERTEPWPQRPASFFPRLESCTFGFFFVSVERGKRGGMSSEEEEGEEESKEEVPLFKVGSVVEREPVPPRFDLPKDWVDPESRFRELLQLPDTASLTLWFADGPVHVKKSSAALKTRFATDASWILVRHLLNEYDGPFHVVKALTAFPYNQPIDWMSWITAADGAEEPLLVSFHDALGHPQEWSISNNRFTSVPAAEAEKKSYWHTWQALQSIPLHQVARVSVPSKPAWYNWFRLAFRVPVLSFRRKSSSSCNLFTSSADGTVSAGVISPAQGPHMEQILIAIRQICFQVRTNEWLLWISFQGDLVPLQLRFLDEHHALEFLIPPPPDDDYFTLTDNYPYCFRLTLSAEEEEPLQADLQMIRRTGSCQDLFSSRTGSQLVWLGIALTNFLGIDTLQVVDASETECFDDRVEKVGAEMTLNLRLLHALALGQSWYETFGFVSSESKRTHSKLERIRAIPVATLLINKKKKKKEEAPKKRIVAFAAENPEMENVGDLLAGLWSTDCFATLYLLEMLAADKKHGKILNDIDNDLITLTRKCPAARSRNAFRSPA